MNLSQFKGLGVINRTPNSFSDQGLSLNPIFFKNQLKSFLDRPHLIIDVGFESTAPMNTALSQHEEWERFLIFLTESKEFSFDDRFISFDTYKIQNFISMTEEFRKIHPKARFIFNDVSGVLDEELKEALIQFKGSDFYYIYTFTHIPSRDQVLDHMKCLNTDEDIIEQTARAFKKAYEFFHEIGLENHLILDPGFGFSKTYEQNWSLINRYDEVLRRVRETYPHMENASLIGLSKKSFLKKSLPDNFSIQDLEDLHLRCMRQILLQTRERILFRVHDPKLLDLV